MNSKNSLVTIINDRLKTSSVELVLKKMGYTGSKSIDNATQRLNATLTDPNLGLGTKSHYDFKYDSANFLIELCKALQISLSKIESEIENTHNRIKQENAAFTRYIEVQTNFIRKNEPVFVLAISEPLRRIQLSREYNFLPVDELISKAQKIVKSHYIENDGELSIWGAIKSYRLVANQDLSIEFSVSGQILSRGGNQQNGGRASLTHRQRTIPRSIL